jgi:hypothetical protein
MIRAYMYTCPPRREVWEATMERWAATDWGEQPAVIWDEGTGPPSQERIVAVAHRMLCLAAQDDADYYLFLEDDLLFNVHLRENLQNWPLLRDGELWAGSLYNPGLALRDSLNASELWQCRQVLVARGSFYGAQAVVLSRAALGIVLQEWDEPGPYDLKLEGIALRHSDGIVLHVPSLVQHVPVASTWGGVSHRAPDFDPFYRVGVRPR